MKIHKMTVHKDRLTGVLTLVVFKDHTEVRTSLAIADEHDAFLDKELKEKFSDAEIVVSTSAPGLVIDFDGNISDLQEEETENE